MTIWITDEAWAAIRAEGRRLHPLEAGGVLLGWRDGENRIVTGVLGPGPASMHGRFAFVPDHRWQVERIREVFAATSGDLDYLGDWHTHPDGLPAMSATDLSTLRRIARRVHRPVMLIAAGGTQEWTAAAWTWSGSRYLGRGVPLGHAIKHLPKSPAWPEAILLS
jgi:integrative and conjugative element protein (TIGR02256 family)